MFDSLSNNKLLNAYEKAIELQLDSEFIQLLEQELKSRGLETANN